MTRTKIGKYEISEQIGVGGFGAVYRGRDPFIKRTVAIKTCQLNDEEIKSRFFREAELAGNLHHRHITTIYDFGVEDGIPYIVQEFLTGEDLDKVVKRGDRLTVARKIEILMAITEGLAYAHKHSIIHRDIKPSNIRILEDGSVKIMDFGIAKSLLSESSLTQTGITLGTSAYLAPEQVRGEALDQRTDIFALGVLAYELLTNRKPFRGEHLSTVLYKILNETPEPMASLAPEVPGSLSAVVAFAMEKNIEDRYASMDAFRQDLQTVHRQILGTSGRFETARNPSPARVRPGPDLERTVQTPTRGVLRPPAGITPPSGALARVPAALNEHTQTVVSTRGGGGLELVHFQDPVERKTRESQEARADRSRRYVLRTGAVVLVLGAAAVFWRLSPPAGGAKRRATQASPARPGAPALPTAPLAFPSPQLGRDAAPAIPTAAPAIPTPAAEPVRPPRRFPVQFSSIPQATLFVDGKRIGPSIPARTVELSEGAHRVRFERSGLPAYEKEFRVGANGAPPIAYSFPLGYLVIRAPAWTGATVLVDSKFQGVLAGDMTLPLSSGSHRITLSRDGLNPFTTELTIPEGEKKTWTPPAPTTHTDGPS
ncbi:MAG TPA: serine/threonine-protein kinase [Thermoanaerobaculia bacterium]|nr:serine/threonine-protein kinase [Thermoanaerobaculia bacterium]